jgi:hypothetical protein
MPEVEEITITVDGGYTQSSIESVDTEGARADSVGHRVRRAASSVAAEGPQRVRLPSARPSADASRVVPGTLVAIRDDETMRWSLVVVRRLKARIGDRVDIGVEYVGQNPRGRHDGPSHAGDLDGTHRRDTETSVCSPRCICARALSSRSCLSRRSSCRRTSPAAGA